MCEIKLTEQRPIPTRLYIGILTISNIISKFRYFQNSNNFKMVERRCRKKLLRYFFRRLREKRVFTALEYAYLTSK